MNFIDLKQSLEFEVKIKVYLNANSEGFFIH
jgi:hypothetical protein